MNTTQYGIGVTKNRFELFEIDDEDPLEVLKIREQEKEARKKTKLSEKENKGKDPVTKIKPVPARKGIKETQNLKPQESQKGKEGDSKPRVQRVDRGERKFNNENREERNNRRVREDRPNDLNREERTDRPERKEFRGELRGERPSNNYVNTESAGSDGRGRGRGGRGGGFTSRGARGGRVGTGGPRSNFDSRGKREYDRQSGSDKTGVKPVDKRDGSGAHNWGNHRDDIEDIRNSISQAPEDSTNTWTSEKNESEVVPEANVGVENEETNAAAQDEERRELTLDEWKALKAPRQKPNYNLRKAGEGEDPSQWRKMYALQKKKEGEEDDEDDEYEYESCDYPQRVGRQKHVLDIDIHFKDTRGGGRGRGGRGTGRGGPRIGMRGNSNPPATEKFVNPGRETMPKAAPKVDDEHDFPSLGQHLN